MKTENNIEQFPPIKERRRLRKIKRSAIRGKRKEKRMARRSTREALARKIHGNRGLYMAWIKSNFPEIYAQAVKNADRKNGIDPEQSAEENQEPNDLTENLEAVEPTQNWFTDFASSIVLMSDKMMDLKERKAAIDIQTERALQNKAPIETQVTDSGEMVTVETVKDDATEMLRKNAVPILGGLFALWFLFRGK